MDAGGVAFTKTAHRTNRSKRPLSRCVRMAISGLPALQQRTLQLFRFFFRIISQTMYTEKRTHPSPRYNIGHRQPEAPFETQAMFTSVSRRKTTRTFFASEFSLLRRRREADLDPTPVYVAVLHHCQIATSLVVILSCLIIHISLPLHRPIRQRAGISANFLVEEGFLVSWRHRHCQFCVT